MFLKKNVVRKTLRLVVVLGLSQLTTLAHATNYRITDLSNGNPNHRWYTNTALNDHGTVIGVVADLLIPQYPMFGYGPAHPILFRTNGTTVEHPDQENVFPYKINNAEQYVGTCCGIFNGIYHASPFIYSGGVLSGVVGVPFGSASAINNSGQVVGYGYTDPGNPPAPDRFAFLTNDLGVTAMNISPPGETISIALGINGLGQVVGYYGPGTGQAFFWDPVAGTTELPFAGAGSRAEAVNNSGLIVGETVYVEGGQQHAAIYQNGAWQEIDTSYHSGAIAVNESGLVLGYNWDNGPYTYDSNDPSAQINYLHVDGWGIVEAEGINASGQIAAQAYLHGDLTFPPLPRPVLLTPIP